MLRASVVATRHRHPQVFVERIQCGVAGELLWAGVIAATKRARRHMHLHSFPPPDTRAIFARRASFAKLAAMPHAEQARFCAWVLVVCATIFTLLVLHRDSVCRARAATLRQLASAFTAMREQPGEP